MRATLVGRRLKKTFTQSFLVLVEQVLTIRSWNTYRFGRSKEHILLKHIEVLGRTGTETDCEVLLRMSYWVLELSRLKNNNQFSVKCDHEISVSNYTTIYIEGHQYTTASRLYTP